MFNKNMKLKNYEIFALTLAVVIIALVLTSSGDTSTKKAIESSGLEDLVLPEEGVVLPIKWGDIGSKMVEAGVIDASKFESLYEGRGGLSESEKGVLYGTDNGNLKIDKENAGFLLNMLWAFGLSNKNPVLEEGPMMNPEYGGADRFASTGGWSLAKGDPMEYYSKYRFISLTEDQQKMVEEVSKNIYRPCCGNSTYFPDCNHGMAMLGLLELLASNGVSEGEMYRIALKVNSYWFPSTYLTIGEYFKKVGVAWDDIDPKEVLGSDYSSGSGYQRILSEVKPLQYSGGGGCGV